ncbi:proteasome subunit beta type-4 [Thrips palmi]|uniref:Proteasome subunit beta n=1 Tax=Thrips palmi TaxID=161013 RepID=A0A6P8Y296_THRPL|nr:proteasome subunit beta type-4 [Thrips palmi]
MAHHNFDRFAAGPLWHNGPTPGGIYNFPGRQVEDSGRFQERSKQPITTGTSVIAFKYDNGVEKGVAIAADMLGSYGSLARFRDCRRLCKVNNQIIVGAGGDYADFQYVQSMIEQKTIDDECLDDGFSMKPRAIYTWLTNILYNRRSKMDPFWNNFIVAGMQDGEPYLGSIDKLGTAYEDNIIGTGLGMQLGVPLIREAIERKPLMSKAEAQQLLVHTMEVLFYRDARSFPKYQLGFITPDGVTISDPLYLDNQKWGFALYKK